MVKTNGRMFQKKIEYMNKICFEGFIFFLMVKSNLLLLFQSIRSSPGNEKLLKDQSIKQRDRFLQTDSRGWTPLHEAAAQTNQTILELTFRGLFSCIFY